ncbi:MAG: hypothetical protein HY710_08455 [Candidatus Latescibacteria bacterium]|nr:hypothetical protein [Candidatus Latescibacterota bacterium]
MQSIPSIRVVRRRGIRAGKPPCWFSGEAGLAAGVLLSGLLIGAALGAQAAVPSQSVPPGDVPGSAAADTSTRSAPSDTTPEQMLRALPGLDQVIPSLSFRDVAVADILRALADRYRFNLAVGPEVQSRITLNFSSIPVADALVFILEQAGLAYRVADSVVSVTMPPPPALPAPVVPPLRIVRADSLLSVDLQEQDLTHFARELTRLSGRNILLEQGVSGRLSGYLTDVPFDVGLRTLLDINGLSLRVVSGVYRIDRAGIQAEMPDRPGRSLVAVTDSLVTMDVVNVDISRVIREMALQSGIDLITYGRLQGTVTARLTRVSLDQALNYLFRGTPYTFRKDRGIYFVGDKEIRGISSSELLALNHLKVEGITDLLPERFKTQATFKIIKELNGLMVIGTQDVIAEVRDFLAAIDRPSPQILLDVLVVDLRRTDDYEVGVTANQDTSALPLSSYFPGLQLTYPGTDLETAFGLTRIARLPPTFRAQFRALEREGRVNIRSQPKIATLNGHEASISIGTVQYFLLQSQGTFPTPGTPVTQTTQRFERIEANAVLKITPWVSASGEITTVIHPEFNRPVGGLNPNVPPTIDQRIIDSTVRLRDGETIILGGLIEEADQADINKFPLLGDIPLLGRLFQYRKVSKVKNQLLIFVTPHLYYGGEGTVDRDKYLKSENGGQWSVVSGRWSVKRDKRPRTTMNCPMWS